MTKYLLLLILVMVAGCLPKSSPMDTTEAFPPAPRGFSADQLANATWTRAEGTLRLRQRATFDFHGRQYVMMGLMDLDPQRKIIRLIAINDFGMKLFDLTVTEDSVTENFLLPQFSRFPRFSEAVAISLRRIFLTPEVDPGKDLVTYQDGFYRVSGVRREDTVNFIFAGTPVQLLEKRMKGDGDWNATYGNYKHSSMVTYPEEILLEDKKAGYRLTLNIEDVKKIDEQTIR